jgi:catechol 2,3-dioxygenase-like lactoylglutathione lyase family enzyme
MIRGIHAMFHTPKVDETRKFLRDKLGFPWSDVGEGWLIFDVAEAEVGVHPDEGDHHDISFYTDDVKRTVAELRKKGVVFKGPIKDQGWGLTTTFEMPGGAECMLYEPRYVKRRRAQKAVKRSTSRRKPTAKSGSRAKKKAKRAGR